MLKLLKLICFNVNILFFRDSPIRRYEIGPNSIHALKANPIEESVLLGAMSDRSLFVIDTRQKSMLKKVLFNFDIEESVFIFRLQ